MHPLAAAATSAEAQDWPATAARLVDAWHVAKLPLIAELLVRVDAIIAAPPITKSTVRERDAAWLALAANFDELVVPTLLATPWPTHPTDALLRIEALEHRPPSPRISQALVALHDRRQYKSVAGGKVSRRIFRMLFAQKDPVVSTYFATLDDLTNIAVRDARGVLRSLLTRPRPPIPEPSDADATALARIANALPREPARAASSDRLLDDVYASPFDDGPRDVLADALTEANDPRGEFIRLQLVDNRGESTPKLQARARALQRAAGNTWLGGIDEDGAEMVEFARGFPVSARTAHDRFEAKGWSTIESLLFTAKVAFTGGPRLVALRKIHGIALAQLAKVELPNPVIVEDIAVDEIATPSRDLPFRPTSLGIDLVRDDEMIAAATRLVRSPFGERVSHIHVATHGVNVGIAFRILAAMPQIERVDILGSNSRVWELQQRWSMVVTRSTLYLMWVGGGYVGREVAQILEPLRALPRPAITKIELVMQTSKSIAPYVDKVRAEVGKLAKLWGATLV